MHNGYIPPNLFILITKGDHQDIIEILYTSPEQAKKILSIFHHFSFKASNG